jgi:hypothetical protein
MPESIRFQDFQRTFWTQNSEISANDIFPAAERDAEGNVIPVPHAPVKLNRAEVFRLIQPYVSVRFMDQIRAVVPLALYLTLFQLLILNQVVEDSWLITGGLLAVIVGLLFFMEGLNLGLMPLGELIGGGLPRKSPLPVVLFITLLLGIGVTFAEPAIGALQAAGSNVSVERAPYLYALLNDWSGTLVLVVGAAVGLAAVVGTLRFLYGWSLKPLIYLALAPVLILTIYASMDPDLTATLGLAWDAGAVTTGPVTVPLVLSLGIGIAMACHPRFPVPDPRSPATGPVCFDDRDAGRDHRGSHPGCRRGQPGGPGVVRDQPRRRYSPRRAGHPAAGRFPAAGAEAGRPRRDSAQGRGGLRHYSDDHRHVYLQYRPDLRPVEAGW